MKHFATLVVALLAAGPLVARAQSNDDNHPKFPSPYDSAHFSWRKPVPRNRLRPLRPDEHAYGVTYDEIDDFLEGKPVADHVYETVLRFYDASRHKRALPYTMFDWPAA